MAHSGGAAFQRVRAGIAGRCANVGRLAAAGTACSSTARVCETPCHRHAANRLDGESVWRLLHARGVYSEVEPVFRCALAIRERALGPEHPDVAASLNNLAMLYHAQGQYGKAGSVATMQSKAAVFDNRMN